MKRIADIIVVICIPLIAFSATIIFHSSYFLSIFLFFGVLSVYIGVRRPSILKEALLFSVLFSIPLCIVLDILAIINKSFLTTTLFPIKFVGLISIEDFFYAFFWVLSSVLFYKYFKLQQKDIKFFNIKWLIYATWLLAICIALLFFLSPNLLQLPYFYLLSGLLWTMPLIILMYKYPFTIKNFFFVAVYFFYFFLLFEIAALKTGQWIFPGNEFLYFVHMFGQNFPLEELILWMVFATPGLLAFYEFFKVRFFYQVKKFEPSV